VEPESPEASCPGCGITGTEISRRTVVAVTSAALPPHQVLRLCRTSGCSLIYYGEAGAQIPAAALSRLPLFKGGEVVCFCFWREVGEVTNGGRERVVEEISDRVRAGDCACDLRYPTGKCCLGEIRRLP
jgi:hypothetical protein